MPDGSAMLGRLSLNQITVEKRSLEETVEACARAEIGWIGAWRHKVQEEPVRAAKLIRDAGIRISSLCRGGFFPAATAAERRKRIEDNRQAIDEAAILGTDTLVLVCGPAAGRDIDSAREMVIDGIGEIVPHAEKCGVRLAIEPLHPMYAAERSVIVTLEQANQIAARFSAERVGVIVDVFHVWWDPEVYEQISAAGSRIFGFHVSDWIVPMPDMLMGRGMMGEGVIEIRRLRTAVEDAGYRGPVEVEIFNHEVWNTPLDVLLRTMKQAYLEFL
jgi:sugar phosphate isomerase/epimerase